MTKQARYRKIVRLRKKEKLTFEQIGKVMRFSRQRAHEIYHRALKKFPRASSNTTSLAS